MRCAPCGVHAGVQSRYVPCGVCVGQPRGISVGAGRPRAVSAIVQPTAGDGADAPRVQTAGQRRAAREDIMSVMEVSAEASVAPAENCSRHVGAVRSIPSSIHVCDEDDCD